LTHQYKSMGLVALS